MFTSCLEKQIKIELLFVDYRTREEKYQKIIELGRELPALKAEEKIEKNRVVGCQSMTYLISTYQDGLLSFTAGSDALISAGLAALLILAYNNEPPEALLKCPPDFLQKLEIHTSLSPNRANGLYSMHLRMKQEAIMRACSNLRLDD